MIRRSKTIVFFGSGPVAAESLRLLARDFQIEAVITKPRPPHHVGDVPVISAAEQLGLPVYTAVDRKSLDILIQSLSLQSRLAIIIDFGIIVSQAVINAFPLGIINSHFSLLPEWRGADPITFAILSGQPTTGVSLMLLVARMDEGPLLAQDTICLDTDITTPKLTESLINISHELLMNYVPKYMDSAIQSYPQPTDIAPTYSRRLTKADGSLDWSKPALQLEREVRAYINWPKSYTNIGGVDIIVTKARVASLSGELGKYTVKDKRLFVYTIQNALEILQLKLPGKPEMSISSFLAGHEL